MNRLRVKGKWRGVKGKLYGNLAGGDRTDQNGQEQQNAGRFMKQISQPDEDVRATIDKYCC